MIRRSALARHHLSQDVLPRYFNVVAVGRATKEWGASARPPLDLQAAVDVAGRIPSDPRRWQACTLIWLAALTRPFP